MPILLALLPSLLGMLPGIIQAVEDIFGGAKQGQVKKNTVQTVVGTVVDAIASVPGNKATAAQKDSILAISGAAIDSIVAGYNAVQYFKGGTPIAEDQGGSH